MRASESSLQAVSKSFDLNARLAFRLLPFTEVSVLKVVAPIAVVLINIVLADIVVANIIPLNLIPKVILPLV